MSRPIILVFTGCYLPGFRAGGPIRTIANMVDQLSADFDFRVVAADRDLGDEKPYAGITVDAWNVCGNGSVFYRSPGAAGWRALCASASAAGCDMIYLNSVFSADAALRPLLYQRLGRLPKVPVLLAPRGELNPGALQQKRLKKRAFLSLAALVGFHRGLFWQASSREEASEIGLHTGVSKDRVFVAPNLSGRSVDMLRHEPQVVGAGLKIAFLSRVSRKKNLRQALAILGKVSRPVSFDIFGPIEDRGYWAECEAAIASLLANITVRYRGEVVPADVERTLSAYDLFFLPTLGENYGHVIREALSAGVPTLISDRTPWRGLGAKGAGADIPLETPEAFVAWIEAFADLSAPERMAMRAAARQLGDDPVVAAANLEANRSMFNQILGAHVR